MNQTIEATALGLAEILTRYLAENWADSPFAGREINTDTNMITELQLDSFQVMEFMLEVEDHFEVAIDLESLSDIQTIKDLAGAVIAAQADR